VKKHFVIIIGGLLLFFVGYYEYNKFANPPELEQFKGSIQNHLVWSIKGECYFVRPNTTNTTYLIRVEDCDKK
jgi:hypothetical protein